VKTKLFFTLFIFMITVLFSCEKEPKICPTCFDEVSWDGYGQWKLGKEGWDGTSRNGTSLEKDCGWTVDSNHAGGVGDIYIVEGCPNTTFIGFIEAGVEFIWAYGNFSWICLKEGWCGSTKEGIRIGDTLDKFLSTYPYFKKDPNTPDLNFWVYEKKRLEVIAGFSDNKLFYLSIEKSAF
jgi:hypothetical protein